MSEILITGASGGLGSLLAPLLRERGHTLRALSRRPREGEGWSVGDTVRGTGLDAAVDGVDTVVHLAGGARGDDVGTRNLAAAAVRARVGHVLMISVVGADSMPIGYFRAKASAERELAAAGVPWTVLRAAQFHTFVARAVRGMTALPLAVAPRDLRFEPVAGEEVAARLADLVGSGPAGRTPDLAGPEVLPAEELVRLWMRARGLRRRILRPSIPGAVGRAYREGANLAGEGADRGSLTWAQSLGDIVDG